MGKYKIVTEKNIEETIKKGVTLLDFWAPWCGPCRMLSPIIEELADIYEGKANICKVNTDEEQNLAVKYGIRSIPTIFLIKDGVVVEQFVGGKAKSFFVDKLDNLIK